MTDKKKRPTFSNLSNDVPLSIDQLAQFVAEVTDERIALVGGQLVGFRNRRAIELSNAEKLFAFISAYAHVRWSKKGLSKAEFFEGLRQRADAFAYVSKFPHFPPIDGVAYLDKEVAPEENGSLDEFLNFFSPASDVDRLLMRASVLTLFWGGSAGARPAFVIVPELGVRGVGVGKTKFAEKATNLVGGAVLFTARVRDDRIGTHLLSHKGMERRAVLVDNVKGLRLSSMAVESAITHGELSGHRMFIGYDSRQNDLTWFFTMNDPAMSRDLADRSIVIRLKPPERRADWERDIDAFIEENRNRLFADVAAYFDRPTRDIGGDFRWTSWAAEVLSRAGKTRGVVAEIKARAATIDDEYAELRAFVDFVRTKIREETGGRVNAYNHRISATTLSNWIREFDPKFGGGAHKYLKQFAEKSPFRTERDDRGNAYFLSESKDA